MFYRKVVLLTLLFFYILAIAACDKAAKQASSHTGKSLYQQHCASCHNSDGSGVFLKSTPANVTTQKDFRGVVLQIKNGAPHSRIKMPSFKQLSDKDINKVAKHLLTLKKAYSSNPGRSDIILFERNKKDSQH